jgi:hypothetical protein
VGCIFNSDGLIITREIHRIPTTSDITDVLILNDEAFGNVLQGQHLYSDRVPRCHLPNFLTFTAAT